MNLFVASFGHPSVSAQQLRSQLTGMKLTYPSLDVRTLSDYQSPDKSIRLATIRASERATAPRKPVHMGANGAILYTGLPVDSADKVNAHDASALSQKWDAVKDRLEGTYAVVRATRKELEIQTDLLGGEAVYYVQHRGGWLFSNSVLILERLAGFEPLDTLGVSMFLHLGQALGDRTLRRNIKIMGRAERWRLGTPRRDPVRHQYYALANLAREKRSRLDDTVVRTLARDLQRPLKRLADNFDSLVCPLTGGKDSRVIAALLMNADIDAKYFTFGDPAGDDARIASNIAQRCNVEHEVKAINEQDVFNSWDENCVRTVRMTDGMRSFHLLGGMSKSKPISKNGRDIHLWGACGEVARGFFGDLPFFAGAKLHAGIVKTLDRTGPPDSTGLVRDEYIQKAKSWAGDSIQTCLDSGIDLLDVPDVFGTLFIDGRRLSNNGRGLADIRDTYTPFASRAFLEAALSLTPMRRLCEPLHYRLLEYLAPTLHRMPFDKGGWNSQLPLFNLANRRATKKSKVLLRRFNRLKARVMPVPPQYSYVDNTFSRLEWFESKRQFLREFSMDRKSSDVWEFVDRDRFSNIMSDETSSAQRSQNLKLLFHIITLLYYDSDQARRVASNEEHQPLVDVSAA